MKRQDPQQDPAFITNLEALKQAWAEHQAAEGSLDHSRDRLAHALYELHTVCVQQRKFCKALKEIGIPRATANNFIEGWERVRNLPPLIHQAAREIHLDLTAKRMADAIDEHTTRLQEIKTATEAKAALERLREIGKRKSPTKTPISITDHVAQREDKLRRKNLAFFETLEEATKLATLQKWLTEILPQFDLVRKETTNV
jgi:hypothetical protein